jgi:glutaminase
MKLTPFHLHLEELHKQFLELKDGNVADYIPELAKVNPDHFGIVIVTVDGHVYQVGDSRVEFSIQSISKAFTYGIALEDNDLETVESKVDVEPSGEAFNSISLEPDTGRPRNPMINAGAIATSGLVAGNTGEEKINRILEVFEKYTGRKLNVDLQIYESEKTTGHRNRAISHLLRNYDILNGDPEEVLDVYFRQCSINVTCRDLALMGATLANDGVNPITGIRALDSKKIPNVLGVMASCGMYDYSGNWIYRVGMPAKSGVGGGIVAVLPGQLGLAVFSPRLDEKGNSVRGLAVCETVSQTFDLHMLHSTRTTTSSTIRRNYDGSIVRSKILRDGPAQEILDQYGHGIRVLDLAGDMQFVSAELVMHEIMAREKLPTHVILNFKHVSSINHAAVQQLCDLAVTLHNEGCQLIFIEIPKSFGLTSKFKSMLSDESFWPQMGFDDIDHALESCENDILESYDWESSIINQKGQPSSQPILSDMTTEELAFISSLMESKVFEENEIICKEGEPADKVFFVEEGQVSVWVNIIVSVSKKKKKRINVVGEGFAFGEGALLGAESRIADIIADQKSIISWFETGKLFDNDSAIALNIQKKLYKNLAIQTFHKLELSNKEIKSLMQ